MKAKTMIGVAVAGALSWSYGALADDFGRMDSASTYGVATPFSPNEAGPAQPWTDRDAFLDARSHSASNAAVYEVVTPLASNEAGFDDVMQTREPRALNLASSHSMANPRTPWSPNEGGADLSLAENMQLHAQQIAEVEHARIAAAEWNAQFATSGDSFDRTAALSEPVGGTSGLALSGRSEGFGEAPQDTTHQPSVSSGQLPDRSAASTPAETERTSAMRPESEYGIPVTEYSTVGVLEAPIEVSEQSVWNVEPLAPSADLAQGQTVYVAPDGSSGTIAPELGNSSPLGTSGGYSAGVTEMESEASSPSL